VRSYRRAGVIAQLTTQIEDEGSHQLILTGVCRSPQVVQYRVMRQPPACVYGQAGEGLYSVTDRAIHSPATVTRLSAKPC
jgi:hypothetical protein